MGQGRPVTAALRVAIVTLVLGTSAIAHAEGLRPALGVDADAMATFAVKTPR